MLFALALLSVAVLGGTLLTHFYDEDARLSSRVSSGIPIGLALFGLVGFTAASILGLSAVALFLTAVLMLTPLLLLFRPTYRSRTQTDFVQALSVLRRPSLSLLFFLLMALALWLVFDRAMFIHDGGIYTGVMNNYGDLPFHITVIERFAKGQ